MKKTVVVLFLALILFVGATTTFAYGGNKWGNGGRKSNSYHGTNTSSPTFVDANGDGVCDNYPTRPRDGFGRGKTR